MITDYSIPADLSASYYEKGYWTTDTIADVWERQVARYGDKEYVRDNYHAYTYKEIDERADRLAAWMHERGIERGDVVTIQLPNWCEFTILMYAAYKVGCVLHPLSKSFNKEDLVRAMNLVDSSMLICPTFSHKTDYELQAIAAKNGVPTLKQILLVDKCAPKHSTLPTLSEVLAGDEELPAFESDVKSDDIACILSTSGTTGVPKAVMLTHNNILFSERSMVEAFDLNENDKAYMPSPLSHATGVFHGLVTPMLSGGSVLLEEEFRVIAAVPHINACGVTWCMSATPFIYDILNFLDDYQTELSTLRLFLCGGAPVPAALIERAYRHKVLLCEIYGSTESCPHVYVPKNDCLTWNGAWSGVAFDGIEIKIVDENGNEAAPGVQGEELSRGPHLFVGYHNNPEANKRALTADGWFCSGDLGYMDAEGRLRINGRKKEIIIRGGENISANEIDAHLMGCPGVADHATIGMPDDRLGERICTFVVAKPECTPPTKESIIAHLESKHVQKRLWPERVELIDAIPRTSSGKIRRFVLLEEIKRRMTCQCGCDK